MLIKKTKEPENLEKAYDYAVFLLSLKLRTVGEIISKMQGRGYTETVTAQTIDRLKNQHYLNDQQYAEIYLENLKSYKNFGFYGIKKKLIEKKLPKELIEDILSQGLTLEDELNIAKRFLKREGVTVNPDNLDKEVMYSSFGDNEKNKEKFKVANRLKSRGFRSEVIIKALR